MCILVFYNFTAVLLICSVSPYDPDSRFNMSYLTRLEEAGIKVVTALSDNINCLETELGLCVGENVTNPFKHMMELWEVRNKLPPMTWRALLNIISQGMNLRELSQQIEDYLQHGKLC